MCRDIRLVICNIYRLAVYRELKKKKFRQRTKAGERRVKKKRADFQIVHNGVNIKMRLYLRDVPTKAKKTLTCENKKSIRQDSYLG